MAKKKVIYNEEEDVIGFKAPEKKGRQKQHIKELLKEYNFIEDDEFEEIDTFQKIRRRG